MPIFVGPEERNRQRGARDRASFDAAFSKLSTGAGCRRRNGLIGGERWGKKGGNGACQQENGRPRPNRRHARRQLTLEYGASSATRSIHGQEAKESKEQGKKQRQDDGVENQAEGRATPQESRAEAESQREAREETYRFENVAAGSGSTGTRNSTCTGSGARDARA
jgi:hypothetical protein